MSYSREMRALLVLSCLLVAATGCRTTHEASAEELARLGEVDGTLQTGEAPADDLGQVSLGAISAIQPALRWLSNKDRDETDSSDAAIVMSPEEQRALRLARFVTDGGRDEWPECITELDDGVVYEDCVLGAELPAVSVGFAVDGSYTWTDDSSRADLLLDFGAEVGNLGVGTSFDWSHDLAWDERRLDGEFGLDWAAGVMLGGSPSATSVQFRLDATLEELTVDELCDSPVGGILDWRARYREGTDPVETTRVTVEFVGCGEAFVTW